MKEVGAFEAKNKLSMLLDAVERGEEVVITRHGKAVARLVPDRPRHDVGRAQDAAARIRARAASLQASPFDWNEWKKHRDDGRP
jgi:prevent-host-death family protein